MTNHETKLEINEEIAILESLVKDFRHCKFDINRRLKPALKQAYMIMIEDRKNLINFYERNKKD